MLTGVLFFHKTFASIQDVTKTHKYYVLNTRELKYMNKISVFKSHGCCRFTKSAIEKKQAFDFQQKKYKTKV